MAQPTSSTAKPPTADQIHQWQRAFHGVVVDALADLLVAAETQPQGKRQKSAAA